MNFDHVQYSQKQIKQFPLLLKTHRYDHELLILGRLVELI